MKNSYLIVNVVENKIYFSVLNNFNIKNKISVFEKMYDIITNEKFLGCIDWYVSKEKYLQEIVIYPHDELDDTFNKINIKSNQSIRYEKNGLFKIKFKKSIKIEENFSEFQSFLFSAFLVNEGKIEGFIFDISELDFQVKS